jgi:hypothetical protein
MHISHSLRLAVLCPGRAARSLRGRVERLSLRKATNGNMKEAGICPRLLPGLEMIGSEITESRQHRKVPVDLGFSAHKERRRPAATAPGFTGGLA